MALAPTDPEQRDAYCRAQDDNWYTLTNWTYRLGIPPVIEEPGSTTVDVIYKDGTPGHLLAKNVAWSQVEKFRFAGGVPADAAPTETKIGEFYLPVLPTKTPDLEDFISADIASSVKVHQGAEALFPHYHKDVSHLDTIDVYRVLQLWEVLDPCIQHAIKKLLVAGGRGHKDMSKDVHEAIVSLQRWEEMQAEDAAGE